MWTKTDPLKVGLHPSGQCARGRTDCRSLAQVISTEEPRTFACCGEVAPGCSPVPQDQWSFCMGCDHDGDRPMIWAELTTDANAPTLTEIEMADTDLLILDKARVWCWAIACVAVLLAIIVMCP